jgi:hypothetical protein
VILGIPKRMVMIVAALIGIGLIYVAGTDKQSAGATAGSPTGCKVTVTADVLNARSAPNGTAGIVGKYNKDAQVDAQPVVQDGFRKLADNKWAKNEFLQPVAGSHCG